MVLLNVVPLRIRQRLRVLVAEQPIDPIRSIPTDSGRVVVVQRVTANFEASDEIMEKVMAEG